MATLNLYCRTAAGARGRGALSWSPYTQNIAGKTAAGARGRAALASTPSALLLTGRTAAGARGRAFLLNTTSLPIFPSLPIGLPVTMTPALATVKGGIPSGRDMRAPQQQLPIWQFEINFEELRDQTQNAAPGYLAGFTQFMQLAELFLASVGQFGQFLFDAWWDDSRAAQPVAYGDSVSTSFTMVRTWGSGTLSFIEPVGAVNAITSVWINGVLQSSSTYFVSGNNILNFLAAPAAGALVTATFSFYYLCQFAEDQHDYSEFMKDRWAAKIKFKSVLPQPASNPIWPPTPAPPAFGKLYFEVETTNAPPGSEACIGFANAGFNLVDPVDLDLSAGAYASLDGGAFWVFHLFVFGGNAGGTGFCGDPGGAPTGFGNSGAGNPSPPKIVRVVVDTVNRLAWWQIESDLTTWYGNGSGAGIDPVAGTGGYPLGQGGIGPTDPLFILLGAGTSFGQSSFATQTLNAGAKPFAYPPPVTTQAWDSTGSTNLNPSDCAPHIILSGFNLTMTTVVDGSSTSAFVRTNTSKIA